jgi:hypothetical protein
MVCENLPSDQKQRRISENRRKSKSHCSQEPLCSLERVVYAGNRSTVDRRRISARISSVLVPDCLEDGLTPPTKPGNIPLSNFTQIIQQLPLFPTTDVVKMDAASIRSGNLLLWIVDAFVKYEGHVPRVDWRALQWKLETFGAMIPRTIDVPDPMRFGKAMGLFLLSSVSLLNRVIIFVGPGIGKLKNLSIDSYCEIELCSVAPCRHSIDLPCSNDPSTTNVGCVLSIKIFMFRTGQARFEALWLQ